MDPILDFEKPIVELERKIRELQEISSKEKISFDSEIVSLQGRLKELVNEIFLKLTPWQRVQIARHPRRPQALDYIEALFTDFMPLSGDRRFGEDASILAGFAKEETLGSVLVIGQQKGRTTKEKILRNFGMAKPEGYRKAIRLAKLAQKAKMPILTLIDTPGAYPGIDAEERGQAEAIAESIRVFFEIESPIVAVVIGEGGSGGALALGVADRVLTLENSIYSVISPESCASILWSDPQMAEVASKALKMDSSTLLRLGVVHQVIEEPLGGAHRDWNLTFLNTKKAILSSFNEISNSSDERKKNRLKHFDEMSKPWLEEVK